MTTTGVISPQWRDLVAERLGEVEERLGRVTGVRGLVLGGSVARGEHWPLSDIDIIPIVEPGSGADVELERLRSGLIDWWSASGRPQTLDLGWLRFDAAEAEEAVTSNAGWAAARMHEPRWLHGIDKCFGGRGLADPDELAGSFARWATAVRFATEVREARAAFWAAAVHDARRRSLEAYSEGNTTSAVVALRESARALRAVLIERWGTRLGSLGREWTQWERLCRAHGSGDLASAVADLADARPADAPARSASAPAWLQERIALAFAARREVGEPVTEEENARDQLAAFEVLVQRRFRPPWGGWIRVPPAHQLERQLAELDDLIRSVVPG